MYYYVYTGKITTDLDISVVLNDTNKVRFALRMRKNFNLQ